MITIWQVMVERELALALERRCGGGEHCCRFLFCSWHDHDGDGDGDGAGQVEMLIVMIQRRSMRVW